MPSVMTRRDFDARLSSRLYHNLTLNAEKRLGYHDAQNVVQDALCAA